MKPLNRRLFLGITAASLVVAGCASLTGPRTIEIPRERLLAKLAPQFPMRRTLAEVFDVEARAPRLQLLPEANRVAAEFDVQATDRLFQRSYNGTLGVSFGVRYEAQDRTLRLTQVSVDQVAIDGLPAALRQTLTRLGATIAQDRLQDYPIHQFKPEDLRELERRGYQVDDLRVTATGLSVKLVPKP